MSAILNFRDCTFRYETLTRSHETRPIVHREITDRAAMLEGGRRVLMLLIRRVTGLDKVASTIGSSTVRVQEAKVVFMKISSLAALAKLQEVPLEYILVGWPIGGEVDTNGRPDSKTRRVHLAVVIGEGARAGE